MSLSAVAGHEKAIVEPTPVPAKIATPYLRIDGTYSGKADYEDKAASGGATASGSAWNAKLQFGVVRPLPELSLLANKGGNWQVRLGLEHERYEFSHSNAIPLPDRLQHVTGVIALEYKVGNQIGILLQAQPGVFFENEIRSNAWNCPVLFGMGIPVSDTFTLALAARYNAFEEHPIIGGLGFLWKISDSLTLSAIPPEPRLTWTVNDELSIWLGGEMAGKAYRTDKRSGSKLGDAIVSYDDRRAFLGTSWTRGAWTLEAAAGVSFDREWDYHRVDRDYSTDGTSPFVKLSARADW